MALNQAEKFILAAIINRFADLTAEDELIDFSDERKFFPKSEHFRPFKEPETSTVDKNANIMCVSVRQLYDRYPEYSLTKKLVEFGKMVNSYLYDHACIPNSGSSFGMYRDNKTFLKMSLLEQNGVTFEYFDERALRGANDPSALEQLNSERVTTFAIKAREVYIDFNLHLPEKKIKGLGEEVYTLSSNIGIRVPAVPNHPTWTTREQKSEAYERRVIQEFSTWATNQALNFVKQTRHLRRQNKLLKDIVIQADISSYFVLPEPEENKKEDGRTTAM